MATIVIPDDTLAILKAAIDAAIPAPQPISQPIPQPVPSLPGVTGHLQWTTGGNVRLVSDTYCQFKDNVLTFSFTTPAVPDTATITVVQSGGQAEVMRVLTIATQPGVVASKSGAYDDVVASTVGVAPALSLQVGGAKRLGVTLLAPSTTYYLTVANRNGYGGSMSCNHDSCGINVDFSN